MTQYLEMKPNQTLGDLNYIFALENQLSFVLIIILSENRSMVVNDVATKTESIFKGAFQRDGGWKYLQNPDMGPATTYALYNVFDDPNETEELSQVTAS